jgi:hypothetical protein
LAIAEVLNELNRASEALNFLNQVRERADLDPITEINQSLLREIILHERRVELAFENKRWHDLVRTGRTIEIMTKNGQYLKSIHGHLSDNSYNVTPEKLIFPIPLREIQIGGLTQNPGY